MISKGCALGGQHSCGRSRLAVRTLNSARAPCSAENRASCWGHRACRAELRGPQGSRGAEASCPPCSGSSVPPAAALYFPKAQKRMPSRAALILFPAWKRGEASHVLSSGLPALAQRFVRGRRPSLLCCCVCFAEAAKKYKLFFPVMQIASVGVNTETTVRDFLPLTFKSCFSLYSKRCL